MVGKVRWKAQGGSGAGPEYFVFLAGVVFEA